MMHDLMGEDEYGDEDYGYEDDYPAAKKKVQEEEYDFMWVWLYRRTHHDDFK